LSCTGITIPVDGPGRLKGLSAPRLHGYIKIEVPWRFTIANSGTRYYLRLATSQNDFPVNRVNYSMAYAQYPVK